MGTLISQDIPYSGVTLSQQSLPIGAIIPYMGTTAPSGYLACDGTVYAISLYPLLAGFIEAQFGSINYFGGNGTTTFAVPNLQGEFLRGAGTNSHSNQGSGGNVGEHQNGTVHVESRSDSVNTYITSTNNFSIGYTNPDYAYTSVNRYSRELTIQNTVYQPNVSELSRFTSRPTNTSVLYIIKAKSDRLDKITFAEVDDTSVSSDAVWSAEKIANLTPIGKVDAFFRNTAPYGYLKCDGSTYNIADYPLLAALFNSEFGSANVYGGNGTTTFAVPNLQGEFLRGAGTNSHTNQGNGGTVGQHQDGTGHLELRYQDGHTSIRTTPNLSTGITHKDSTYETATNWADDTRATGTLASNETYRFTSRPTNTSVLYCISAYR